MERAPPFRPPLRFECLPRVPAAQRSGGRRGGDTCRGLWRSRPQLPCALRPHPPARGPAAAERYKPWQAEYWINEMRHHILELACLRLGENALEGRGFDRLPSRVREPLAKALVRSLTEAELRGSLAV